jgi:hypothetical protein
MSKGDRENMGTETKGDETHFDLRCLIVVEKSVTNKSQSKKAHLQRIACVRIAGSMHSTPTAALKVILMLPPLDIYIEAEAKQATYRLKCSGEFTRPRFDHSEVFEKMTNEWPSLLVPEDKIVPIIGFWKKVFNRTSAKKLLAKAGNVGNLAIRVFTL